MRDKARTGINDFFIRRPLAVSRLAKHRLRERPDEHDPGTTLLASNTLLAPRLAPRGPVFCHSAAVFAAWEHTVPWVRCVYTRENAPADMYDVILCTPADMYGVRCTPAEISDVNHVIAQAKLKQVGYATHQIGKVRAFGRLPEAASLPLT